MSATRKSFSQLLLFAPLLAGAVLVFFPGTGTGRNHENLSAPQAMRSGLGAAELMFLLQYVGTDYPGAVGGGKVLDELEYQEMLEFSRILAAEYPRSGSPVDVGLEELHAMVRACEEPAKVLALTRELVASMTRELRLVTYPSRAPSVAQGRGLYATACAQCHGDSGDGVGRSAAGMVPPPTSFRGERMKAVAPHQLFNATSFGIAGTTMPAFQETLTSEERWHIAFYLMTLRDDFAPAAPEAGASVPLTVRDLATRSDQELADSRQLPSGVVDYLRSEVPETPENELLRLAERKLDESYRAYEQGEREDAVRLSLEAYLEGIEPAEATLASTSARLVRNIERELASYRASMRQGAPASALEPRLERLKELTDEARGLLAGNATGGGFVFAQSMTIMLREGIEAVLLVALLMSYLTAAGQPELRRSTLFGALAGVAAGFVTWFAAQYVIVASTLQREALEGITSLLAAAVLFSVSFWIIHNADVKRWKSYIEKRAQSALGAGSGLALASVAFLGVYREAFETVLFYQALFLRHEEASAAVIAGMVGGLAALGVVVVLMFHYGKRIPLKPFFAVTGVLLGLLSFVFAGYGIAELQKIGWIKETPLPSVPYLPLFELQATVEGLALQLGILLSFLLAWFVVGSLGREPKQATAQAS